MRFVQNHVFPVLLLVIVVCVSLALWSLPALARLGELPALLETDRVAVILLLIQLLSPVLVVLFCSSFWQLVTLLLPYLFQPLPESVGRATSVRQSASATASSSLPSMRKSSPALVPVQEARPAIEESAPLLLALPASSVVLPRRQGARDAKTARASVPSAHVTALRARRQARFSPKDVRLTPRSLVALSEPTEPLLHEAASAPAAPPPSVQVCVDPTRPLVIRVFGKVRLTVQAAGKEREIAMTPNAKRTQLLAYLACSLGREIGRDRMVEDIFGHGDEEATPKALGFAFESHKKFLRLSLREGIESLNREVGYEAIPLDLTLFTHRLKIYFLSPHCQVADLEAVEAEYRTIEQARRSGQLADGVSEEIKLACDRLLEAAKEGDFLQEMVKVHLSDLEPWADSWIREPYTRYRDYSLSALWYQAEYYLRKAKQPLASVLLDHGDVLSQRACAEKSAQKFDAYATKAIESRFDLKVSFKKPSERIVMAERALRRALVLYGMLGSTDNVDQIYAAFCRQMRILSANNWQPSADTLADLRAAKEQTREYRFSDEYLAVKPRSMGAKEAASR